MRLCKRYIISHNLCKVKLYTQAVEIVKKDKRPTTSYIQRRLSIGYNKAATLIEQMEKDGIISAPNRTGKRQILIED